jgi:hypothetical protein
VAKRRRQKRVNQRVFRLLSPQKTDLEGRLAALSTEIMIALAETLQKRLNYGPDEIASFCDDVMDQAKQNRDNLLTMVKGTKDEG